MKRALALLIALAALLPGQTVADYDDEPVDIVVLEIVEPTQKKVYAPNKQIAPLQEYDWDDKTIDAVASIYWAETGRGATANKEKLYITQLIWNRARYGSPFPDNVYDVCMQRGEFNRGKISDKNRELARVNLNKVRSQSEGYYQGLEMWSSAIYMTREGGSGVLTFQDDQWVTVYRIEKN